MFPVLLAAQAASPASTPVSSTQTAASTQSAPEISTHDELTTFQVKVNLVEVRVVVRDAQGKVIGNLKQDDFQLLDNGKPQVISKFLMEHAGAKPAIPLDLPPADAAEQSTTARSNKAAIAIPQRYLAYLFDDVHLATSGLSQARNAALKQLQTLRPTDRASISTTSGQNQLDFTDDRAQLEAALNRLMPRPVTRDTVTSCPNISYYVADLIQNKHDERALQMATQDTVDCAFMGDTSKVQAAEHMAQSAALRELNRGDEETNLALGVLRRLVRRIAEMPGERIIVMVSPGFLNPDALQSGTELMERALHSNVVINTLDARGLYTDLPDVSDLRPFSSVTAGNMQIFRAAELAEDNDILADLADTTGGTFFHNNNDLNEGFRRLSSPPDYSYLLGFSPQNLKLDGRYHKLKIILKAPAKGTVQARKGYYAPKVAADSSEQAKQAIEDAVFSQEEIRDIPVELHTQFFKSDENDAKLSVVVRMDVRHVRFRKVDGRNNNDVTIVSALFDHNGNFLSGNQKSLQLRLKDGTIDNKLNSGITLKSTFDVKPGSYIVRLVVRDEDGQLAAQNSAIEIP